MKQILDTDIIVAAIRNHPPTVRQRLLAMSPEDLAVSTISIAELSYGAAKSTDPERTRRLFQEFLEPLSVLSFDRHAAEHHGRIRYETRHQPIWERDLLIAAIAVANELAIVTGNVREFERVPGLQVEAWRC